MKRIWLIFIFLPLFSGASENTSREDLKSCLLDDPRTILIQDATDVHVFDDGTVFAILDHSRVVKKEDTLYNFYFYSLAIFNQDGEMQKEIPLGDQFISLSRSCFEEKQGLGCWRGSDYIVWDRQGEEVSKYSLVPKVILKPEMKPIALSGGRVLIKNLAAIEIRDQKGELIRSIRGFSHVMLKDEEKISALKMSGDGSEKKIIYAEFTPDGELIELRDIQGVEGRMVHILDGSIGGYRYVTTVAERSSEKRKVYQINEQGQVLNSVELKNDMTVSISKTGVVVSQDGTLFDADLNVVGSILETETKGRLILGKEAETERLLLEDDSIIIRNMAGASIVNDDFSLKTRIFLKGLSSPVRYFPQNGPSLAIAGTQNEGSRSLSWVTFLNFGKKASLFGRIIGREGEAVIPSACKDVDISPLGKDLVSFGENDKKRDAAPRRNSRGVRW